MTHETTDPPRKRERPAEGTEIVRLAMEWRRLQKVPGGGFPEIVAVLNAHDAMVAALDSRL